MGTRQTKNLLQPSLLCWNISPSPHIHTRTHARTHTHTYTHTHTHTHKHKHTHTHTHTHKHTPTGLKVLHDHFECHAGRNGRPGRPRRSHHHGSHVWSLQDIWADWRRSCETNIDQHCSQDQTMLWEGSTNWSCSITNVILIWSIMYVMQCDIHDIDWSVLVTQWHQWSMWLWSPSANSWLSWPQLLSFSSILSPLHPYLFTSQLQLCVLQHLPYLVVCPGLETDPQKVLS